MMSFKLPFKELIIKENKTDSPYKSSFVFYHLPNTLGNSLGQFLRNILLDHIGCVAICGVEIFDKEGPVKTEFVPLAGVNVTSYDLIVNLKKIILEELEIKEEMFCLELNVNNDSDDEKIVTAKDFNSINHVKISNPQLVLATLAPRSILKINIYCQRGLGYQEANKQRKYFVERPNVIPLDTNYSPIKSNNVMLEVNSVLTSLIDEEEQLTLTISTNGSIKAKKALQEAIKLFCSLGVLIEKQIS